MSTPETAPVPEPGTPGGRSRRVPADPPQMSITEKLACEWEARHDVAARRRIADASPLQHYLSHARSADGRSASSATGRRAAHTGPAATSARGLSPGVRSWLRWGEDGGPEHPVIPRC